MKSVAVTFRKLQSGAIGLFVCVVLMLVFGLIGMQNVTTTSVDLYLSNSKQHIEEARQLAYAGLRHYTHNFGTDEKVLDMIRQYRDRTPNPNIVRECSRTVALPAVLIPTDEVASPATPDGANHTITIRGIVVPYNCNRRITRQNYRATFEIMASVNCTGNNGVESGCVKRSFVITRQNDKDGTLPYDPIITEIDNGGGGGGGNNGGGGGNNGGGGGDDGNNGNGGNGRPGSIGREDVGF